jgi:hypothetical protein
MITDTYIVMWETDEEGWTEETRLRQDGFCFIKGESREEAIENFIDDEDTDLEALSKMIVVDVNDAFKVNLYIEKYKRKKNE